jgi:RNA polymerase sigma-70 factor (ECF subfamily)
MDHLPGLPATAMAGLRRGPFSRDQVADFYRELQSPLSAFLRRQNLSAEDAEDIVHESFVRLLSQAPEDLHEDNVRYWLFRVAHNLAIDRQRAQWRSAESDIDFDLVLAAVPSPAGNPEKFLFDREQWRLVKYNLARLTPLQRRAIHLRITGLSYKAIARRLNGTAPSIAELVRRGLKRLGEHVRSCEA